MYRFALGPRWIAGHLVVVLAVVVMVNLAFWQLRRLDERRSYNERVRERTAAPIAPFGEVAAEGAKEFRRVSVRGRFERDADVLIGYRSLEGLSGHHVVTPLRLADGSAVLVNRGWVPTHYLADWPVADAAPPRGDVTVTGYVRETEPGGGVTGRDDGTKVPLVRRADVALIGKTVTGDVHPFWIQLGTPLPDDGVPAPIPLPDLGEGSHLSYAVQWFTFSAGALVGWSILVRMSARRRALARGAPDEENEAASAPVTT